MNVLVTGGAGFIGSNVVAELLRRGHRPTVFDDFSSGFADHVRRLDVRVIEGDVRDADAVRAAMAGQDAVCHLAASVGNARSIADPVRDASVNVLGTVNVLQAMREAGVRRIVYSSSAGIYGEPIREPVDEGHPCEPLSPYGATKWCGEKLCLSVMHLHGIRAVCVLYFNVFGENQRYDAYGNVIPIFCARAAAGEPLSIYGDGRQTRDFVHVGDVARANAEALERDGVRGPINVGTGHRTEILALAGMVARLADRPPPIVHAPERPGDVRHCTADVRRMKALLGVSPRTDMPELLAEYYRWFVRDRTYEDRPRE